MFVYWLMFFLPASLALIHARRQGALWFGFGSLLAVVVGLRFQVGPDWDAYLRYLERAEVRTILENMRSGDPAYQLLNSLSAILGFDVWFVNLVCAMVFAWGVLRFSRRMPEPFLALAVAVPYLVTVVAMGYTRQAVAIGLSMAAFSYLIERSNAKFLIAMAFAAAFHSSAVLLLPFAALANTRRRLVTMTWAGVASGVFFFVFLSSEFDQLWSQYVESSYAFASEGALIRTVMNGLPAAIFLVLYRRMPMNEVEKALWFWMSLFALLCLALVRLAPTAVDRVALYFIPVQVAVWSYLPARFAPNARPLLRVAVIVFYLLVMFVWLNYASHATAWLPYQFWPIFGG